MCQYDDVSCHLTAVLGFFIGDVMDIRAEFAPLTAM